jgi:hypothetical protein
MEIMERIVILEHLASFYALTKSLSEYPDLAPELQGV